MPFVAECPFCNKGKLLCPDHAVGWSATCPNNECGSSFTITRSEKAATGTAHRLAAHANGVATRSTTSSEGQSQPAPIIVPRSGEGGRPSHADPESNSAWTGPTLLAMILGSSVLLSESFLNEWPVVAGLAGVALLALLSGFIGVSLAKQRRRGEKRAWLGPLAGGAALLLLALPYVTGARWGRAPEVRAPDFKQRTSIPIKPQSGSSKQLAESDWLDASKDVVQMGDLWLRLTSAAVEPVALKSTGQKTPDGWLVLRVQLANNGVERQIDYQSWADGPRETSRHPPILKDSSGRTLRQRTFPGSQVVGQLTTGFVFPGKSIDDVLVFEPPAGNVDYLRLELPLSAVGAEGNVRLQVPRTMIKFR